MAKEMSIVGVAARGADKLVSSRYVNDGSGDAAALRRGVSL